MTKTLAVVVANSRLPAAPDDAIERPETHVLDVLSADLSAGQLPWLQIVRDDEIQNGAGGVCSVYGSKKWFSGPAISFVNGRLFRLLEAICSVHITYVGGAVVASALATGEAIRVGGRHLTRAMIVGCEAVCRIGDPLTWLIEDERGFQNLAANGQFSSAAPADTLLRLDVEHQRSTFGFVGSLPVA